jgi:tetratricopeptide (TPR) repeat protein
MGAYAAADRGYRRRSSRSAAASVPRDRYLAGVFNDFGVLRKAQGRYDEALAFYQRALPLVPRGDRQALATLAHNLGGIEHARGNYADAEPHARRSVRLRTALVGANHPCRGCRRRRAGGDRRGARAACPRPPRCTAARSPFLGACWAAQSLEVG